MSTSVSVDPEVSTQADGEDEGLAAGDEGPGEEDEFVPEGQQQAVSVVRTTVSAPLGLWYEALRRQELELEENQVYSTLRMSTSVSVDPEVSTQADGDTESEPTEDPIEAETPESPLIVAPPTSLPESTPPTLVPILRMIVRMAMRVSHALLSGLSASMADVAPLSEFAFRMRFRSSYESSSSLPESLDSKSMSEDAEDEGPTAEDEGLAAGDEGPGEEDEFVPEGQQQAVSVVGTTVSAPLGLWYEALRRRELELEENHVYSTLRDIGELFTTSEAVKDEIFSQRIKRTKKRTKSDQNWTKTGSVAKPGKV
nr:hypothetical protein [Tanacetum cinerariifolium]